MKRRETLLALFAIAGLMAAAPHRDSAVIVNSGSTNSVGYKITVWSDGSGSALLQSRDGTPAGKPKSFSLPEATTSRFFADLAAARKANAVSVPCMKSASFGTTTHITWQGWVSPDLDCPPKGAEGDALVKDVAAIRQASGVPQFPPRQP